METFHKRCSMESFVDLTLLHPSIHPLGRLYNETPQMTNSNVRMNKAPCYNTGIHRRQHINPRREFLMIGAGALLPPRAVFLPAPVQQKWPAERSAGRLTSIFSWLFRRKSCSVQRGPGSFAASGGVYSRTFPYICS